jgi:hypothetical protein
MINIHVDGQDDIPKLDIPYADKIPAWNFLGGL